MVGKNAKVKVVKPENKQSLLERVKNCRSWLDLWKMRDEIVKALEGGDK